MGRPGDPGPPVSDPRNALTAGRAGPGTPIFQSSTGGSNENPHPSKCGAHTEIRNAEEEEEEEMHLDFCSL